MSRVAKRKSPSKEAIKAARERFGQGDRQAAELMGVDVSTWRGWESGRHYMPGYAFRFYLIEGKLASRGKLAPAVPA